MAITWAGTAWAALTAYALRARVTNGGNVYQCTTAGTSAASGGPSGTSSSITDGSVVWSYVGANGGAVTDVASELSTSAAATQATVLASVDAQINATQWGDLADFGRLYLAAHLGTVTARGGNGPGGPVASEAVGDLSRSYANFSPMGSDALLDSTPYGKEYRRLRRLLSSSLGFVA